MKHVVFTGIVLLLSQDAVYGSQRIDVASYHKKHKAEFDSIRNSIRIIVDMLPGLEEHQKKAIIESEIDSLQQLYSDSAIFNITKSRFEDLEAKLATNGTGLLNAILKHFSIGMAGLSEQIDLYNFILNDGKAKAALRFLQTPACNVANLFTIFADIISNSTDPKISDEYTYMAHMPEPQQVKAKAVTFKLQQPMKKFNGEQVDHIFMPIIIGCADGSSNITTAIATAYATDKFTIDYKLSSYSQNRLDEHANAKSSILIQEEINPETEKELHTMDASVQRKLEYTHRKKKSTKRQQAHQRANQQREKGEKKKKTNKKQTKQTLTKEWETFDLSLPFNFNAWKEVTLDTDFRAAKQTRYASEGFSVNIEDSDTEATMNEKITKCLTGLQSFIQKHTTKLKPEYKKLLKEREASFSVAIKDIQANAPLEMLKVLYAALMYNLGALQQQEANKPGVIAACYSAVHNNFFDFTVEHLAYDLWPAFMELDKYWYYGNALAQVLQSLYVRQLSKPDCGIGINYIAQKLQEKAISKGRQKEFTFIHNHATNMARAEFKRLAEDDEALLGMLTSLWICKLSDESLAFPAEQSIGLLYNGAKELHKTDLFDMYNKLAEISARNEIKAQKKTELPQ